MRDGRLATLEEIDDWQPYDHIGWRLASPTSGPIGATVDLGALEGGTRVHVRWVVDGPRPAGADTLASLALEKRAALERLAALLAVGGGIDARQETGS